VVGGGQGKSVMAENEKGGGKKNPINNSRWNCTISLQSGYGSIPLSGASVHYPPTLEQGGRFGIGNELTAAGG